MLNPLATRKCGWYHNRIKHVFKILFGRSAAIRTGEWSVEYMWAEIEMNKRYLKGKEEGREEGRMEERKNTEAERKRADELAEEVVRLKAELEALKK